MTKLKTLDVAALSTVSGGQQAASWTTTNNWASGAWAGAKAGAQAAWNNSWGGAWKAK